MKDFSTHVTNLTRFIYFTGFNSIVNYEYIQKNKVNESFFKQLILNSEDSLKRVLNGGVVLSNVNKENQLIPYLAI